jgi:hypothetical protein
VRLGYTARGRREENAVFEVWEEAMYFESVSADETAGIFGVAEVS